MSVAELARRTGIKQSTMARRMTGETAFDLDDLELIADALEVAVADLIPRLEASAGLSRTSDRVTHQSGQHVVRTTHDRPTAGKRRDSSRPDVSTPASRRRPVSVRPPDRTIAS